MSDLYRLKIFKEIADQRSFAKAAELFGVSKAAVSKQLAVLEEHLSVQLLERTTRQVALTQLGSIYLEQIRPLLAAFEEAEALVSQIHKIPSGRLRITAARHFGEVYLIPNLPKLLDRYPNLHIDLELAERIPEMIHEKIDILVGMSIPGPPTSIQKVISKTKYILCASPKYVKKFGEPTSPEDLANYRYITHSMRKPNNEILFANGKRVHVTPFLSFNDSRAMLESAKNNLGIVQLHQYFVAEAIRQKELVRILDKFECQAVPLYLNYLPQRFVLPKIRCFVEFVTELLRKSHS